MILTSFAQIENHLINEKKLQRICLICAEDEHSLSALKIVYDKGIISPILVGDTDSIKAIAEKIGMELSGVEVYYASTPEQAADIGVELINNGKADFLMKGKLETSQLLHPVVNKKTGLYTGNVMSHVVLNEVPSYHKLLCSTDGGMLPYPNLEQKRGIIVNAVSTLLSLGYECPKVAVLTCSEKVNPKMPECVDADALKNMNIPNCIVEGPISLDLAVSKETAELKNYESPVAGDADILVAPNIHAGNILGKSMFTLAGGKMAGIIVGAKCPIILTSRASSTEEKYNSILLACAVSEKGTQKSNNSSSYTAF